MTNTQRLFLTIGVFLASSLSFALPPPGSLAGKVTSESGGPVAGAVLLYHRVPALVSVSGRERVAAGESMLSSEATSGADGSFIVEGLPAGRYVVCVETPSMPYLDPCKWSGTIGVDVVDTRVQLNISLRKEVFLKVHLNDPKLLLPLSGNAFHLQKLTLGVMVGQGGYWAADLVGSSSGSFDFQLAVPLHVPLGLWAVSPTAALIGRDGSTVGTWGRTLPFEAKTYADQIFTFNAVAP